jgi:hypothetical protein
MIDGPSERRHDDRMDSRNRHVCITGNATLSRRSLLHAFSIAAAIVAAPRIAAAQAPVTKRGRFRYGDDLVDIRLEVRAADMSDDGAAIEPAVVATARGTVLRVEGKLERRSFGDSFRALRIQHDDGSWHDVNIWVPLRL